MPKEVTLNGKKPRASPKKQNQRLQWLKKHPFCVYCGCLLIERNSTLDHYVPRSKGGNSHVSNLHLVCIKCNSIKGSLSPERWKQILPILKESGYFFMSKLERRKWRQKNPEVLEEV